MNILERALLYLWRNKGKSGILLALLVVISTLTLFCISIGNAADASLAELRERLGGYFLIKNDMQNGGYDYVNDEMVQKILKCGDIKAYNGMDTRYFFAEDTELAPGRYAQEGDKKAKMTRVIGNTNTAFNEYFVLEYYELKEGRHISPEDEGKALVSEGFARRNQLSIGDSFTMRLNDENLPDEIKENITSHGLEIVGIFSIETAFGMQSDNTAECDIEENFIFTDTEFIRNACEDLGYRMDAYVSGVSFFVKDPKDLDQTVNNVMALDGYNWDEYVITKNNKTYDDSAAPLERLSGIVKMMVFIIAAISAVMLSLILFLWMRDRVHEIGVYLSIGKKRTEILGQHIVENLLVAVLSFVLAWGICIAASQAVEQTIGAAFFEEKEEMGERAEGETEIPALVQIGVTELAEVAGIGGIIILISTGISSAVVLRMKPKEVLSLMS